jgi:7-cyano-7-deazaguanine synthase in queuosine biosynthesis
MVNRLIKDSIKLPKVDIDRSHFVIWSGGVDSTIVLCHVAKKYGTQDNPVHSIYLDHHQIDPLKKEIEKERRRVILQRAAFNKNLHIVDHIVTVKSDGPQTSHTQSMSNIQGYLWLAMLMPYFKHNSNVYMGAIREDDSLIYIHEFNAMIKAANTLLNSSLELFIPLKHLYKHEAIQEINRLELYDHIWYCESPAIDRSACGRCSSCEDHQQAMILLASRGSSDWAYCKAKPMIDLIHSKYTPIYANKLISVTDESLKN